MLELYQPIHTLLDTNMHVLVAFSGGRDSAALLHCIAVEAGKRGAGHMVTAVYVNHNLQAAARDWPKFAENFVAQLVVEGCPVRLVVRDVHLPEGTGQSVEALARDARYKVIAEEAHRVGADVIALGHHRRDQVETFLLQALRGSGVAGLAAMPASIERHGLLWARPWLHVNRDDIDLFVSRTGIDYVEDPTNSENNYARNKMRNAVLPQLNEQFPDAEVSIAQSALWCAEASEALSFMAANDMLGRGSEQSLSMTDLLEWPAWRKKNLLRYWYQQATGYALPTTTLERILEQRGCTQDGPSHIPSRGTPGLVSQGGTLSIAPVKPAPVQQIEDRLVNLNKAEAIVEAPEFGGYWTFSYGAYGLDLPMEVTLGPRRNGLRFQKGSNQPVRAIKNQFQAAGIAAVERDGPYLYVGENLLWAPGLGLDARMTKPMGWVPKWHHGPAPDVSIDSVSM